MRRGAYVTGLVVIAVVAIAVVAIVDAVRGGRGAAGAADVFETTTGEDGSVEDGLTGPELPSPGALEGMLVFADREDGCRLATLSFATLAPAHAGLDTGCDVWASPSGRLAVISLPGGHEFEAKDGRALVRFWPEAAVLAELGILLGEPTWSPDGARVAWCGGDEGQLFSVVVATPSESKRDTFPGCRPRFAADGTLLMGSVTGNEVWSDAGIVLAESDILAGLADSPGGEATVLGFDRSPQGTLAVTAAVLGDPESTTALELWENGSLTVSVPVRGEGGVGELLRFSPDGSVFAIGALLGRAGGPVTFVDLRLRRSTLDAVALGGFAWSPDGAWLAVAADEEIAIYSRDSDVPVYRIPLSVRGLNWVADPGR